MYVPVAVERLCDGRWSHGDEQRGFGLTKEDGGRLRK